jgi:hypothetical protein
MYSGFREVNLIKSRPLDSMASLSDRLIAPGLNYGQFKPIIFSPPALNAITIVEALFGILEVNLFH